MSTKSKRLLPLSHVLLISALAGAVAYFGQTWVQDHIPFDITTTQKSALSYAVIFLGLLIILFFIDKHTSIKFSKRVQGEKAKGIAPQLARFVLVILFFLLPLFFLIRKELPETSLQKILATEKQKPAKETEQGYSERAREKLEALIEEEGQ